MLGVRAIRDPDLVIPTAEGPVALALADFKPRPDILRNPHCRALRGASLLNQRLGIKLRKLEPVVVEAGCKPVREPVGIPLDPQAVGRRDDVRPPGGPAPGGLELRAVPPLEQEEDPLDVLACAQPVDAKIRAGAGKLPGCDVADLRAADHPARRADLEIRE